MSKQKRSGGDQKLSLVFGSMCSNPDCSAAASSEFATQTPLCDQHIFDVYRTVAKRMNNQAAQQQSYMLLPMENELVDGPCVSCGHAGYLQRAVDGQVRCCNGSCMLTMPESQFFPMRNHLLVEHAGEADVVYYMRSRDLIKIGTSANLTNRFRGLATSVDELIGYEIGNRAVERQRHQQFREWRVRGEWFEASAPLRRHINTATALTG